MKLDKRGFPLLRSHEQLHSSVIIFLSFFIWPLFSFKVSARSGSIERSKKAKVSFEEGKVEGTKYFLAFIAGALL